MGTKVKLAIACLARKTFDYIAAQELYSKALLNLEKIADLQIYPSKEIIYLPEQAIAAGEYFASANVDGVILFSGTFHLGHLALEIKKKTDKPILLWAPEELPYDGGKIRLNSVCGINLDASNLYKAGYYDYTYSIGDSIDLDWINAIKAQNAIAKAAIAIAGYRADGFFNLDVNELALYKTFGCLIDHYELSEIYNSTPSNELILQYKQKITSSFELNISQEKLEKTAVLCAKFVHFFKEKGITALALRCWPEFARDFGIAPCAAMSVLQAEGYIISCEGDIDCTLTMIAHRAMGEGAPYIADISQADLTDNSVLLWHCGAAPLCHANTAQGCSLESYHAGGAGVTADFVLKEGQINLARLDSVNGKYRLFCANGTAINCQRKLKGTYAKAVLEEELPLLLDKIIYNGLAHHVSVAYGDYSAAFKILARNLSIEIL